MLLCSSCAPLPPPPPHSECSQSLRLRAPSIRRCWSLCWPRSCRPPLGVASKAEPHRRAPDPHPTPAARAQRGSAPRHGGAQRRQGMRQGGAPKRTIPARGRWRRRGSIVGSQSGTGGAEGTQMCLQRTMLLKTRQSLDNHRAMPAALLRGRSKRIRTPLCGRAETEREEARGGERRKRKACRPLGVFRKYQRKGFHEASI